MAGRSLLDNIFLIYFAIHIPITLLIDAQALVPDRSIYPQAAVDLVDFYISDFGDFLMAKPPLWFQSLMWAEMLVQVPFFFVAVYAFAKCRNWIRIPALMYGTHLVTVMTPILFETAFTPMDPTHRLKMFSVYLPWFLIPLALTIKMVLYPKPFGDVEKQRANKPKRK